MFVRLVSPRDETLLLYLWFGMVAMGSSCKHMPHCKSFLQPTAVLRARLLILEDSVEVEPLFDSMETPVYSSRDILGGESFRNRSNYTTSFTPPPSPLLTSRDRICNRSG